MPSLFAGMETTIGAAGFASGWMLLWCAAGAIPILIHLLTRRRQVQVSWAAIQLLQHVVDKESKRIRFEQLLLLLLRVAILGVLALALARPFLAETFSGEQSQPSRPPRLWIACIDTSYSMGYREAESTRFQAAREKAAEFLSSGVEGDAYALVELSDPSRAVVQRPSFDRARVIAEVRRMQTLDTGCNVASALRIVQSIAETAIQNTELPNDVEVAIFTDLGTDAWQSESSRSNSESLRSLSAIANLEIIPFVSRDPQNWAVTSLTPEKTRSILGETISVRAEIANFGILDNTVTSLQLSADGRIVESQEVNVTPGETQSIELQYTPPTSGPTVLSVSIPADRLNADNSAHCVVDVREKNRLLFVDESPDASALLRLSLQSASAKDSNLDLRVVSPVDLSSLAIEEWDAILVSDIASIDSRLIAQLKRFVDSEGSVILFFGPNTQPQVWNELTRENDLLGFEFAEMSAEGNWSVDPLEYKSPIVSAFAGFPDAGLLTTPIFRYWKIRERSEDLLVDVAVGANDPLIVRHVRELAAIRSRRSVRGTVASVLSAPQSGIDSDAANWNAIAAWPSFVPLMQRLTAVSLDTNGASFNLTTGEVMEGNLDIVPSEPLTILLPNGDQQQVLADTPLPDDTAGDVNGNLGSVSNDRLSASGWVFTKTQMHGVYRVETNGGKSVPYAVNLDPKESSLESTSLAQLPIERRQPDRVEPSAQEQSTEQVSFDFVTLLLILLIVMLAGESLLSWQIGRRVG